MKRTGWLLAVPIAIVTTAVLIGCTATPEERTEEDAIIELSSEDISAQLLDEGDAIVEQEPLDSVQAELATSPGPTTITLDVLEVTATSTGTLVRMQVTAPELVSPVSKTFSAREFVNPEYVDDMDLIDPVAQESLAPISAAEGGRWCQCSNVQRLGPAPTPLTAVFPAIDETATTVDLRFGNFPVVEDLPITR